MGDGVCLIQPNGQDSEVVAVAQQAVSVAKLRAQAGGCTVKRGQVSAGAFHQEVEGNVVVGDEAGVEAVIANAGDRQQSEKQDEEESQERYPAAYDGVVGVTALTSEGAASGAALRNEGIGLVKEVDKGILRIW